MWRFLSSFTKRLSVSPKISSIVLTSLTDIANCLAVSLAKLPPSVKNLDHNLVKSPAESLAISPKVAQNPAKRVAKSLA